MKVARITDLFNETVLYSNKTYFLEEVSRLKKELREQRNIGSLAREKLTWEKYKVKMLQKGNSINNIEYDVLASMKK